MGFVVYVAGWLIAYFLFARELVRSHRRDFPSLEWRFGDTFFVAAWSPFAALFWPLLAPWYVVARIIHPALVRATASNGDER